ncbi:MAG: peptidase M14 [Ignavibacteriae bacterium]|nr:peptidase M14 [Ignavibacteriota bacterium]
MMLQNTARQLFQTYDSFRVTEFSNRKFPSEQFHHIIDELNLPTSIVRTRKAGESLEGRMIKSFSVGNGTTSVLLWSQMHGDESTATMAIADILNFFKQMFDNKETQQLLASLSIHFLPMLNPDGAARCQRRTAQGIDMNRDALALRTPEANILRQLQQELKPEFGFNLHDQELSTVASSKDLTAIALLAPVFNEAKEDNDIRLRAKYLAATFAETMNLFIPNRIARYDDAFEPRAFGDNMQKWGTSTLLVESGHDFDDPNKWNIRKLNVVGILSCLFAITTDEYRQSNISFYNSLPFNEKKAYDVIIRNVIINHETLQVAGGKETPADIAISYQVDTHSEETPLLVDIGDLHTYVGLKEIDGKGKIISSSGLRLGKPFAWK